LEKPVTSGALAGDVAWRIALLPHFDVVIESAATLGAEPRERALNAVIELGTFISYSMEFLVGVKKTGKGRRKLGRKKRRMRSKIRHRK
jgi:hypothetical protein